MTVSYETLEEYCMEFSRLYWLYTDIVEDYYLSDEEIIARIEADLKKNVGYLYEICEELLE